MQKTNPSPHQSEPLSPISVRDIVEFILQYREGHNVWTNDPPGVIALSINNAISERGIHVAIDGEGKVSGVCLGKVDPEKIIVSQLLCKDKAALRQIISGAMKVHGLGKKRLLAIRKGEIVEYKNVLKALKILWADQITKTKSS